MAGRINSNCGEKVENVFCGLWSRGQDPKNGDVYKEKKKKKAYNSG
jgi:hypothetical protein